MIKPTSVFDISNHSCFVRDNVDELVIDIARVMMTEGVEVCPRGEKTKELRNCYISVPATRSLTTLPSRRSSPFHQLGEALWVLAGRNDVAWLEMFLHRASDFSQDGKTWRTAYGRRLREWDNHIDQIKDAVSRLNHDPYTRQAVSCIWNSSLDIVPENPSPFVGYPCHMILNFSIRDSCLDVTVFARSCDMMWGLTGANIPEWSLLNMLMARTLGISPGRVNILICSLHLYEHHFERAEKMLKKHREGAEHSLYNDHPEGVAYDVAPVHFDACLSIGHLFFLTQAVWRISDRLCTSYESVDDSLYGLHAKCDTDGIPLLYDVVVALACYNALYRMKPHGASDSFYLKCRDILNTVHDGFLRNLFFAHLRRKGVRLLPKGL
jgi:thymidylate synthase